MGKGFGQPKAVPTRNATQFMRAFGKCYAEAKGDKRQVEQFLQKNLAKLDEYLLEALPHVFPKLVDAGSFGDKQGVASLFGEFGNAVSDFSLGDRALNLELSIAAYQVALQTYTRDEFPKEWAATQNNLGAAYSDRIRGDRAENLEQAIAAYELSLQVRTRDTFPEKWAATQNNLGVAYCSRVQGDRAENLEQAIAAYELSLKIYTRDAFPEDWARNKHNLGNAYRDRILGKHSDNLKAAIDLYQEAAQAFTQEAFPLKWAENQGCLAEALIKQASLTDNSNDLDTAITLLKEALEGLNHRFGQGVVQTVSKR